MPTRMLIVFNPAAGARRRRRLFAALDLMRGIGLRPEVADTERRGHAAELARNAAAAGVPIVVAAGGDGTIAEVADGLAGSDSALGVLPLGTANVLALELGIPRAPAHAAAVLAMGRTALLHPGLARHPDGRELLFVQMLGAGFDAAVVHNLSSPLKRAIGKGAYVLQTLREMPRYPFAPIRAEIDGRIEDAASVIVSKGRLYAGRFLLAPGADPRTEGFHVALFRDAGVLAAMRYGAALPLGLLPRMRGVEIRCAETVRLEGPDLPAQADGDAAGCLPVMIGPAPRPMRIVVP
ncbi:diacylglycerol kinase family lipid kinase [Roseomonas terrae]|jgi:diacylglycerol kinase (ATP)|uniref:Diacylglycerol kinase family lipid kinase n=1 Tax=Neoroseomonas terrae TaxID=424799 RepID=A0ABS5EGT9_9PROT|nr:diacylglycerol kinase family protein [Neoroseomonas terrae]MBR0650241.1 diacylglycerol kinase family lipid kinase [Neoroseomonas terrae]